VQATNNAEQVMGFLVCNFFGFAVVRSEPEEKILPKSTIYGAGLPPTPDPVCDFAPNLIAPVRQAYRAAGRK
jgi:hypothetical protein